MADGVGELLSGIESAMIVGRGEMAEAVRSFDWSQTPLGPIQQWPQSLRTTVQILLSSRYAMWMAWGPELTFLHNDAYRPTLGIKDAWALGARARDVWAEIWTDIGPRIESVLKTGKATYDEGLLLFLERSGFPEETYHTFSYSPLADDDGRINGMLCVVTEETDRVISERRVETLRHVASALASTQTEEEVLHGLSQQLNRNKKDLPFTLTYLFDDRGRARLATTSGISREHPLAVEQLEPGSIFPWPAHEVFLHRTSRVMEDLSTQGKLAALPMGDWNKPVEQAVVVPIKQQGQDAPAGFLVAGTNPYRRYDAAYSGFVDLLTGQIGAALSNARAYEAERKRAEALAELDRVKTTFFSNVSHEFRTPLTLMLGPLEEVLRRGTLPQNRELITVAHRNSLRLLKLVNSLLDFSRIEAGRIQARYEPVDLAALTAEIASNFRAATEQAGLDLIVNCPELAEPVYVDREMWEKIVLNLISNAFKFTFKGSIRVELSAGDGMAELRVKDTGTGIPPEELPRLFDRFHRVEGSKGRTHEGTGIGLALVQELVKTHGGSVSVESRVEEGSVFTVQIPLGRKHLPADRILAAPSASSTATRADAYVQEALRWLPAGSRDAETLTAVEQDESRFVDETIAMPGEQKYRVLLAEDNADMRDYVRRLLSPHIEVTAVANGREALTSVLENPPDLILSDVMMPVLDGFALLKELRSNPMTNMLPVILLSARAGEESRVEGVSAGADDYLVKPFSARELFARVSAHLKMARLRKEALETFRRSEEELRRLQEISTTLIGQKDLASLLGEVLDAAIEITRADMGHIQLLDPASGVLKIVVHQGFGRPLLDFFNGVHGGATAFETAMQRGQRVIVEDVAGAPLYDSESRKVMLDAGVLAVQSTPLLTRSGKLLGMFSTHYRSPQRPHERDLHLLDLLARQSADLIERQSAEQELIRINAELRRSNEDLNQFAFAASHDLQEPLRMITSYSQLLIKGYRGQLSDEAAVSVGFITEGTKRMRELLADLLAYTHLTADGQESIESVNLNLVLQKTIENCKAAIEESNAIVTSDHLPTIPGYGPHFLQLFQNLIGNAIKYRGEDTPRIHVSGVRGSDAWRLAVADNGMGIDPEYHEKIFGVFKRLHGKAIPGTGIGLAICQRVVERYGGRIWVESQVNQGATFYFTLPAAKEANG